MKIHWLLKTGIGFALFSFTTFAAPLDNWHWRNPLPDGNPQSGPHTLNGIVFAAGKFVAVGAAGVVSISTDNTNWIESATATTNNLNGLIYASGQFIAVGDGGVVETSPDGINWVSSSSGTINSLKTVAYANGKYVAVGGSVVITSPNAISWSSTVSGISGASGLAGGSAGFVAIGGSQAYSSTNNLVYYSANGSTWTSQGLTAPGSVFFGASLQNSIVTYANGIYLIGSYRYASSMSADCFIFSSADGNNWNTNVIGNLFTGSGGFSYDFFMMGSNHVIAAGAANRVPFLQFSTDGIIWSQTNSVPYAYAQNGLGPIAGAYGNGSHVIVAGTDINHSLPPIYTSTDGGTWTDRQHAPTPPTGPTYAFTSIATNNGADVIASGNLISWSSNGLSYVVASNTPPLSSVITFSNKIIGVGSGGTIYVSSDGLSWTQRNSCTASNLRGLTADNGLLVTVGDNGAIQTSPTGTIWTSRLSGSSLSLYGAAYSNGLFVVVGQLGTVLTSPDGINWTGQDSGQLANLLSVTYGSAGFLAVGPGGTILTSPDGINWTKQNSSTSATLESVSFGNGYYLACGDNAVVLTSPDGVNWAASNVGATGGQNFYGSAFLNNHFAVVGSNGSVIESDAIAPLFDVQIHRGSGANIFTVFVTPGSNFRIQSCPDLAVHQWLDAAVFNNAAAITQWTNAVSPGQKFYRAISP